MNESDTPKYTKLRTPKKKHESPFIPRISTRGASLSNTAFSSMREFLKSPIKKTPSKRSGIDSPSSSSHTTNHSHSSSSSSGLAKLTLTNSTFATTPLLPGLLTSEAPKIVPKRRHTYKLFPNSQASEQPRIISPVYGVDVLYRNISTEDYGIILPRLRGEEYRNQTSFNRTPPLLRPSSSMEMVRKQQQQQQAVAIERVARWRKCFGNTCMNEEEGSAHNPKTQPEPERNDTELLNYNLPLAKKYDDVPEKSNKLRKPSKSGIKGNENISHHTYAQVINASKPSSRHIGAGVNIGQRDGCMRLRSTDGKHKPTSRIGVLNGNTIASVSEVDSQSSSIRNNFDYYRKKIMQSPNTEKEKEKEKEKTLNEKNV